MNRIAEKNELLWRGSVICLALIACCVGWIAFLGATIVLAQDQTFTQTPEARIAELKERLNLTDEQVTAVRPIIEEHVAQGKDIFKKYQGQGKEGFQAMQGEIKELQASTQSQLSAILTEEQMAEYGKMREEERAMMRERAKERMQRRRGGEQ